MVLLIANTTSWTAMFTLKVGHIYSSSYTFLTNAVTWACFKIKTVNSPTDYDWQQPCIYVEWDCKTGRQLVFISSLRNSWVSSFLDNIPDHEKRRVNPFAWHHAFAKEVLQIYDSAYWNLRDIVRAEEKAWHSHGILLFNSLLTPARSETEMNYRTRPMVVSHTTFLDISIITKRRSRLPITRFKLFLQHKSVGGRKVRVKSCMFCPHGWTHTRAFTSRKTECFP